LTGRDNSKHQQHKQVTFFLDECLPYGVAEALKTVGYPITSWREEFRAQQGALDPWLIPYLGGKQYTWVTKDDKAKKEHEPEIRAAGISVVWIRGLDRPSGKPKKNKITVKDLHRMLTDKLDFIEEQITGARGPLYCLLYMKSGGQPAVNRLTLEQFFKTIK
jgi:hypothetical protein